MPIARHSLDCCICLFPPEATNHNAVIALSKELLDAKNTGFRCPTGNFVQLHIEQNDRPKLYANHQGGYYVRCPLCGQNIAQYFSTAVEAFRKGAPRTMRCVFCTEDFFLETVESRPPLCFAREAIILRDVETASLGAFWEQRCDILLSDYRIIFRRVG